MRHCHLNIAKSLATIAILGILLSCSEDPGPVRSNEPPSIDAIEVRLGTTLLTPYQYNNIAAGLTLSITCIASDPENDNLSVSWLATVGDFNRTDSTCVDWTAPDTGCMASIIAEVSDGETTVAQSVALGIIHTASLAGGDVSPGYGSNSTTFTYEVTFTDPTNQTPGSAEIIIDGQTHTMTQISGEPVSGSLYRFQTELESGQHQYYFRFVDYRDSVVTFPTNAYKPGPVVTDTEPLLDEDLILITGLYGISLVSTDGATFVFNVPERAPEILPGHIIATSGENDYLRKVVSTNVTNNQMTVQTAPAALGEAILKASYDYVHTFTLTPCETPNCSTGTTALVSGIDMSGGVLNLTDIPLINGIIGSENVTATIIDGFIGFEPTLDFEITFENGQLTAARAIASGDLEFGLNAIVGTSGPVSTSQPIEIELARTRAFVTHNIDWFPVCYELTLTYVATVEIQSASAGEVEFGSQSGGSVTRGAQFSGGTWTETNEYTFSSTENPSVWSDYGSFSARVGIKPVLEISAFSRTGMNLDIETSSGFDGVVTTDPSCHWSQYAAVGGSFQATGSYFDPVLADYQQELFDEETVLIEDDCFDVTLTATEHTFGGAADEVGYAVINTSDGGTVIAGSTTSYGAGGLDVYLLKLNAAGNLLWERTFGGPAEDCAYSVVETPDGGLAVAGYTWSFGAGEGDVYLIKTNVDGELVWQKTFGGALDDRGRCVIVTPDGGLAVAGRARSWSGGICDFYLVKTDVDGNLAWQQNYGGYGSDRAYSLTATSDGGYALAGYTKSYGVAWKEAYLLKTDANGDFVWHEIFDFVTGDDCAYSLVQTADDGLVLAGFTPGDAFLVKTDASGSTLWQNSTLGGLESDGAYSVMATSDGGFVFTGFSHFSHNEPPDVFLVKTDDSGNDEWHYRLGGYNDDTGYSIIPKPGGGYIIVGETYSFGSGGSDVYLIQIDEN